MWKLNKAIAKEYLPDQPRDFEVQPWWHVSVVNLSLEEYRVCSLLFLIFFAIPLFVFETFGFLVGRGSRAYLCCLDPSLSAPSFRTVEASGSFNMGSAV
jgi:hypothetical protein